MATKVRITVAVDPRLADLAPRYASSLRKLLSRGEHMVRSGDFESLADMAHRERGASASFNLLEASALFRDIETHARAGDGDRCIALVRTILAHLRAVDFVG